MTIPAHHYMVALVAGSFWVFLRVSTTSIPIFSQKRDPRCSDPGRYYAILCRWPLPSPFPPIHKQTNYLIHVKFDLGIQQDRIRNSGARLKYTPLRTWFHANVNILSTWFKLFSHDEETCPHHIYVADLLRGFFCTILIITYYSKPLYVDKNLQK